MPLTAEVQEAVDFLVRNGQLSDRDLTRRILHEGIATRVYGPIFSGMVEYGADLVRAGNLDPHAAAKGLEIAGILYTVANGRYLSQEHHLSGEALTRHQEEVLRGNLTLIDERVAVSRENSIMQVIEADAAYRGDRDDRGYQGAVAASNYGLIFEQQTMTSGAGITERLRANSPTTWQTISYSGMTHLDASNAHIAQTLEGICLYASIRTPQKARVRIIDIGSGHGATVAAIIQTIKMRGNIDTMPEIAMTCLEQTPHFYDQLAQYTQGPDGAIALDLDAVEAHSNDEDFSQFGALTTMYSNAPGALRSLDIKSMDGNDEIVVLTANYVFHRLASDKKQEIMEKFSQLQNVVFLIGDLVEDTSVINRRHFNAAANGPQNTGNRSTTESFTRAGYEVINIAQFQPCAIDPDLAQHLVPDSINPDRDGHFWIAVKGDLARASLGLVNAPSERNAVVGKALFATL